MNWTPAIRLIMLVLITLVSSYISIGQSINTDIFGNIIYQSSNGEYSAKLEENIFDDLIFSDSRGNKITLEKKYISLQYGSQLQDQKAKLNLFRRMMYNHRYDEQYVAKYSVDIFDKVIIEDNRGSKIEIGKDIYDHTSIDSIIREMNHSIRQNIHGGYDYYISGEWRASLSRDYYGYWIYEDALENELRLSTHSWQKLLRRHGSLEQIFDFLVYQFLLD